MCTIKIQFPIFLWATTNDGELAAAKRARHELPPWIRLVVCVCNIVLQTHRAHRILSVNVYTSHIFHMMWNFTENPPLPPIRLRLRRAVFVGKGNQPIRVRASCALCVRCTHPPKNRHTYTRLVMCRWTPDDMWKTTNECAVGC